MGRSYAAAARVPQYINRLAQSSATSIMCTLRTRGEVASRASRTNASARQVGFSLRYFRRTIVPGHRASSKCELYKWRFVGQVSERDAVWPKRN